MEGRGPQVGVTPAENRVRRHAMARISENIKIYVDFTGRRAHRSWSGHCGKCNKACHQWVEETEEQVVVNEQCKACGTGARLYLSWGLAEWLANKATERRLKGEELEAY